MRATPGERLWDVEVQDPAPKSRLIRIRGGVMRIHLKTGDKGL